eukprot:3649575-Rhodomonas_salina.1
MSGTETGYNGLSAVQCPVLRQGMIGICYAMSGTEIAYGVGFAMRCPVLMVGYLPCDIRY